MPVQKEKLLEMADEIAEKMVGEFRNQVADKIMSHNLCPIGSDDLINFILDILVAQNINILESTIDLYREKYNLFMGEEVYEALNTKLSYFRISIKENSQSHH